MPETKTEWVKMKPVELEKVILDLHKEGHTPAKIGLILRDKHGIPKAKILGKRITAILRENKVTYTTDKHVFEKKIDSLHKHISKHKHDYTAHRSLTKKLWTIKKLD